MAVKINLLDWRTELSNLRKTQFFAMLGVGAALAIGGVGVVYFGVQGAIDHQRERNSFLQQQIVEMDKKIKEIEELEKVKANLLARMKVIEELQASRAAMVHFFDEILNTLPEGVYIKSLKQQGPNVTIEGVAESNNRVSAYMKNIESSRWFAEPRLVVINTKDVNKRRQSEFQMRFQNLTRQLRCLVCQNQDLADSDADLAKDLRRQVFQMMQEGKTDDQIKQYLVSRYNDFVLYDPPLHAGTWLLWFGPFAFLALGAFVVLRILRQRARAPLPPADSGEDW